MPAARGDRFECPICGGRFRWLIPYGHGPVRRNALCPRCLALERHRLLWLYLEERTDFFAAAKRVLHVAPEPCFVERFRALHGDGYVTVDLRMSRADVLADILRLPFADESFDVAICNHVLEHVDDDIRALRELHRVLARRGWAILQSPVDRTRGETYEDATIDSPHGRARAFGQWDHVRIYGLDYGARLAQARFDVVEDDFVSTLPPAAVARYALPTDERVFVCTKR
ncbi:MAG: class I SAM-dependent methyltransferase [Thermoleophilia bacterium]|nr:class I SAM-dependent methyltransferase [Gaiellaceae bacterium]MDW8338584.1 class I SAM-dependent methyltransferase [Thermoleophilia bacterium]